MTEINKKLDLATVPPTNNDGDPYILPLDIYKEGYSGYNISNWFKGRVGDNGTPFAIRWYSHGRLLNIQGMRPFIEGQVGDYTIDDSDPDSVRIDMAEDASNIHIVGDVDDTQAGGVAIYRLINQAFPKSGIFYGKIGFMGTQDDGTLVNTGVDIVFKVLAGHMNMLGARKFYVTELEKAWLEMRAKFKQYDKEYDAKLDQELSDLNTKITNEIKRAEDTLGDTQASIDENIASLKRIRVMVDSIEQFIDANDVVRLKDFNQKFDTLENKINHDLENISPVPLSFADLDAVKTAYPTGTTALIVTDDGHRAVYRNNQWQDGGVYNSLGVANNSIGLEQLSDKSLDDTAPNLYSEDSPNLTKGGFHKSDGSFQENGDWGEFSVGVQKGETIAWNQATWFYTFWKDGKFVSGGPANNSYTTITVPDNVDTLKIPVAVADVVKDFNRNLFCIVRGGENIPYWYPQNNVLDKFYVPLKNASHQLGYGRIVANDGNLNITKIDENYYLIFPTTAKVFYGSRLLDIQNDQNRVLLAGVGKNLGTWLYYNPISQLIESFTAPNESDSLINLGVIYDSLTNPTAWTLNTSLDIIFNNKSFTSVQLDKNNLLPNTSPALISGTGQINIDLSKNTMQFDNLFASNSMIEHQIDNSPIDISKIKNGAFLFVDTSNWKLTSQVEAPLNSNCVAIGAWWTPLSIDIYGSPNIYIDGVKYNPQQPLKGHKINVLGDSISYGINTSKSYVGDLETVTGAETVRNYGLASASIAQRTGKSWDWDTVDPLIVHYQEMDKDADVIFLFGGVNDWVAGRPLGKFGDTDITTFYGALDTLLANLRSQYGGATILEATPLQTDWTTRPAAGGTSDGKNSQGLMLADYVDAIKQVAAKYSVPVLDLYHGMFYPFNSDFKSKYMTDSLHPTRAGHLLLADKIGNFINSNV